jgi:hypothetical protein
MNKILLTKKLDNSHHGGRTRIQQAPFSAYPISFARQSRIVRPRDRYRRCSKECRTSDQWTSARTRLPRREPRWCFYREQEPKEFRIFASYRWTGYPLIKNTVQSRKSGGPTAAGFLTLCVVLFFGRRLLPYNLQRISAIELATVNVVSILIVGARVLVRSGY